VLAKHRNRIALDPKSIRNPPPKWAFKNKGLQLADHPLRWVQQRSSNRAEIIPSFLRLVPFHLMFSSIRPVVWALPIALALNGCETTTKALDSLGTMKDKAFEATGIKKPETAMPDVALPARRIPFVLTASTSLNTDDEGHSLALVVRVYRLKSADAFLSAPYATFATPETEKQRLGEDLVEVREILLVPGQKVDVFEKVSREASYLGVVALYREPSPQHWKYAFNADLAQLSGITLAAHACALGVVRGKPHSTSQPALAQGLGACHTRSARTSTAPQD